MGIFRSYDVRGVYGKDIDESIMRRIGEAFAVFCRKDSVVAMDVRISSPALSSAFIEGASSRGINVINARTLPLGTGMFHAWQEGKEFAYITASHLPKEWCGVKFFHANGIGFLEEENMKIRAIFDSGSKTSKGFIYEVSDDIIGKYSKYLYDKIRFSRKLNIAIDNGNGAASLITKKLFEGAGNEVDAIFDSPDGNFPNRLPDPLDAEIGNLKEIMSNYDIGIAYDGDGDRMAVVDENGKMLSPEQTSYIILSKLLASQKGPIIANVECTRLIDDIAAKFSRPVIRAPVGHTFLMQYVNSHGACYGVESAGHYCVPSIVPFDDAIAISMYAAASFSESDFNLSEIVGAMPVHVFERKSFECPDDLKFDVMGSLKTSIMKRYDKTITIDGVRIDFENGWALLRSSNTSPYIRLTVEGNTKKDFCAIQKEFIGVMESEFTSRGLSMKEEHTKNNK